MVLLISHLNSQWFLKKILIVIRYDMKDMIDFIVIRLIYVWETNEIKNFYLKIKWDCNFIRLRYLLNDFWVASHWEFIWGSFDKFTWVKCWNSQLQIWPSFSLRLEVLCDFLLVKILSMLFLIVRVPFTLYSIQFVLFGFIHPQLMPKPLMLSPMYLLKHVFCLVQSLYEAFIYHSDYIVNS